MSTTLKAEDMVGLKASFTLNDRRVVGIITAAVKAPNFMPGDIEDFRVTVRGATGQLVTVSMCETYMSLPSGD